MLEKGDILIAVSFWVNSIKDVHHIPVKRSNFKIQKLTSERIYLKAENFDQDFDCPIDELNIFHSTGDDSFTGLFTSDKEMENGFGKLYHAGLSEKFNLMWGEALKKYYENKE